MVESGTIQVSCDATGCLTALGFTASMITEFKDAEIVHSVSIFQTAIATEQSPVDTRYTIQALDSTSF